MIQSALKVVSVDDNPIDSKILERFLSRLTPGPLSFTSYEDPEAAVAALPTFEVDVIFLDYNLGMVSGLDVLRELLELGVSAPVIVLTGGAGEDAAVEAIHAGAADYLLKSGVSGSELQRALNNAFEANRRREVEQNEATRAAERAQELEGLCQYIAGQAQSQLAAGREAELALIAGLSGSLSDMQRECALASLEERRRVEQAIETLVQATKVGFGRDTIRPVTTKLSVVLESVIASRGDLLELSPMTMDPELRVDTHWLQTALTHVVEVAAASLTKGHAVAIEVTSEDEEFVQVRFPIGDAGIAPDLASNTGEIMDLGFYVAQRVVSIHGGDVSFLDFVEGQSEIIVRLPLRVTSAEGPY